MSFLLSGKKPFYDDFHGRVMTHNNIMIGISGWPCFLVSCGDSPKSISQEKRLSYVYDSRVICTQTPTSKRVGLSGGHSRRAIDLIDLSSDPLLILLTSDPLATGVNSQDKEAPLGC